MHPGVTRHPTMVARPKLRFHFSSRRQALEADQAPLVASCNDEPHQCALGCVAFFLSEAGEEAFSITRMDAAGKVRLDLEGISSWLCRCQVSFCRVPVSPFCCYLLHV